MPERQGDGRAGSREAWRTVYTATAWSDPCARPLADLGNVVEFVRGEGEDPTLIRMSLETFLCLAKRPDFDWPKPRLPSGLNRRFAALGLPPVKLDLGMPEGRVVLERDGEICVTLNV